METHWDRRHVGIYTLNPKRNQNGDGVSPKHRDRKWCMVIPPSRIGVPNLYTGYIPSDNLTYLWKIIFCKRKIIIINYRLAIFHSYVNLPESNTFMENGWLTIPELVGKYTV
jgi:hypothetical protein